MLKEVVMLKVVRLSGYLGLVKLSLRNLIVKGRGLTLDWENMAGGLW